MRLVIIQIIIEIMENNYIIIIITPLTRMPNLNVNNAAFSQNDQNDRGEATSIRSLAIRLMIRDTLPEKRGLEASSQRSTLRRSPLGG